MKEIRQECMLRVEPPKNPLEGQIVRVEYERRFFVAEVLARVGADTVNVFYVKSSEVEDGVPLQRIKLLPSVSLAPSRVGEGINGRFLKYAFEDTVKMQSCFVVSFQAPYHRIVLIPEMKVAEINFLNVSFAQVEPATWSKPYDISVTEKFQFIGRIVTKSCKARLLKAKEERSILIKEPIFLWTGRIVRKSYALRGPLIQHGVILAPCGNNPSQISVLFDDGMECVMSSKVARECLVTSGSRAEWQGRLLLSTAIKRTDALRRDYAWILRLWNPPILRVTSC
eukprot:g1138.t1